VEPIGSPETSVTKHQSTLSKIPEELRSHLHGGENLKSRPRTKFMKNENVFFS
jgi:hypothetical protein